MTYVLFPDEGHGFARPENNLAFYAVAEAFLAKQLGGRYEPIGDDFAGSTITVPDGSDQVPGLADALKKHAAQRPAARGWLMQRQPGRTVRSTTRARATSLASTCQPAR